MSRNGRNGLADVEHESRTGISTGISTEDVGLMNGAKTPESAAEPRRFVKTGLEERLGTYGFIVTVIGIPLQLSIAAFLGYLWYQQQPGEQPGSDANQRLWRQIVLNQWMAPTITLATVVIRLVVGAQLALCTALAAGLILETGAVRFQDGPKLSILRAYNGGPFDIVWIVLQRLPQQWRLSAVEGLVIVLYVVGLVLQFSSTLFVSDLGETVVHSNAVSQKVPVFDSTGTFVKANGFGMWTKSPVSWPTFAESRNDTGWLTGELSYTGTITRAFLPFEAHDRLLLRSYEGAALVQTARTICVPAELSNATFNGSNNTGQITLRGGISNNFDGPARLWFNTTIHGAKVVGANTSPVPFECPFYQASLSGELGVNRDGLMAAICAVGGPLSNSTDFTFGVKQPGFRLFAFFNTVGSYYGWTRTDGHLQRTANENGWATYHPVGGLAEEEPMKLAASVCSFRYEHKLEIISASIPREPEEYKLGWDDDIQGWNIDPILRHLGVMGETSDLSNRGLFRLDSHKVERSVPGKDKTTKEIDLAFDRGISMRLNATQYPSFNTSLIFCTTCTGSFRDDNVHPAHTLLLGAALNATNNPAAALDALWATWSQTIYHSAVGQFKGTNGGGTGSENSTMVWATKVLAPRRWTGFAIGAGLLVCHVFVTVIIVLLFAMRTEHSFRGGLWQALAQAVSGDHVIEVLEHVSAVPDSKVQSLVKLAGLEKASMSTRLDVTTGKVRLTKRATWRRGCT